MVLGASKMTEMLSQRTSSVELEFFQALTNPLFSCQGPSSASKNIKLAQGVGCGKKKILNSFHSHTPRSFSRTHSACALPDCWKEKENNVCAQTKWLSTLPRFKTKAWGKLEIAYSFTWWTVPTAPLSQSGDRDFTSCPPTITWPWSGSYRRRSNDPNVLFPDPLGPTTAVTDPAGTSKLSPWKIGMSDRDG